MAFKLFTLFFVDPLRGQIVYRLRSGWKFEGDNLFYSYYKLARSSYIVVQFNSTANALDFLT